MKRFLSKLLTLLGIGLILAGLAAGGLYFFRENYLHWNGTFLYRQAQRLDLGGKPVTELEFLREFPNLQQLDLQNTDLTPELYGQLRREYPQVAVIWDVPFQNGTVPSNAQKLRLTDLTEEDIAALDYVPGLTSIDAWDCEDYAALAKLQAHRPECKVFYSVELAGKSFDCDIPDIDLVDAEAAQLAENLRYLPRLRAVYLTGKLPTAKELAQLEQQYPDIAFFWELEACGQTIDKHVTSLALDSTEILSPVELDGILPYCPELKHVDLLESGLPQEGLISLAKRWPEVEFLFTLTFGNATVRTDAEEIDLSNYPFGSAEPVEAVLPCFRNLKKAVLCECGISSAEMAALGQRWPDTRFVWSVDLGGMLFRTDALHYTPNRWGLKVDDEDLYDLRYCTDMVCVDIGHMEDVTNCEWAAFMPNLKYLILAQTHITDLTPLSGLKNLVFLELFQSWARDYSPLLGCTALEDINLSYTYGDPTPISQMPWLKRIWWNGWWWAQNVLTQTHPHAELEFHTVSSTGGTWREGKHYYAMRDFIGMDYMTG